MHLGLSLIRPFPADLPLINAHKILGILYLFFPSGSQNLRLIECLQQGQRRSSPAAIQRFVIYGSIMNTLACLNIYPVHHRVFNQQFSLDYLAVTHSMIMFLYYYLVSLLVA